MAHLLLIDALNLIRRLYAVQERPYLPLADDVADGTKQQIIRNTEAMLHQALTRLKQELQPSHALLVFDGRDSEWRKLLYPQYKANRKPMPAILADALPEIKQQAENIGFKHVHQDQFEADDVIASIAVKLAQHGQQVTIVSTDKGFLPLLSDYIHIYDAFGRQHQTIAAVQQKFGVPPEQLVRYWSLVGDSTNNIPGVNGIGPKGAHDLLALGATLSDALEHPDCHRKLREKILVDKEQIKNFMQILTLKTDVQVGLNLQDFRLQSKEKS
ncbi:flap endonuclease Xni [Rheinheimera maricola]|uniref:Flap endonuclease Xni n=1 Tax=Rheinheimera maricola TaxID=2793282 RepID=A0ABS7XBD1_9GAMM|nr:flap endonuclease Xni [Rheinheimera maricola]MBZ9612864.1 flap endonuclease Xni [Rheinheimera maricola]